MLMPTRYDDLVERAKKVVERWETYAATVRRDNSTCQICFEVKPPDDLHVAFRVLLKEGGELNVDNLFTLCSDCQKVWVATRNYKTKLVRVGPSQQDKLLAALVDGVFHSVASLRPVTEMTDNAMRTVLFRMKEKGLVEVAGRNRQKVWRKVESTQ